MKERIIFHIDVNNAFLSWTAILLLKQGYKQDIRKIPSIIGGDEKERRGIVLAKSPIAKKYGIQTAETIYQAKKKCPSLQMFPANFEWYSKQSNNFYNYLTQYSPTIEQFSVDECFVDMTGTNYLYKNYEELAYKIKEDIKKIYGFTVNVGIGNNKLCAKMASDFEKPDKVHTLYSYEIEEKMWPLPVGDLFMIGKKTTEVLNKLNINTIGDLAKANKHVLEKHFKNMSEHMINSANGIDESQVTPRKTKNQSISTTETLSHDTTDEDKLKEVLFRQTQEVSRELREQKQYAKTVAIIYKDSNFITYSQQEKLSRETNNTKDIYLKVIDIFERSYKKEPIRLIGVRLSDLTSSRKVQISLFEEESVKDEEDTFQETLDNINKKFGKDLITPASLKTITKKDNING